MTGRVQERAATAIRQIVESILTEVHTCMPGQVTAFSAQLQTCSVQPCLMRKFYNTDPQPLPIIEDVPVVFPGTGGLWLVGDVKVDSYVLLLFSERALSNWQARGGVVDPELYRKHALSDAIAIAGLWPDAGFLTGAVASNTLAIRNSADTIHVQVSDDGTIEGRNSAGYFSLSSAGTMDVNGNLTVLP